MALIAYLTQCVDEDSQGKGVTVLIDARSLPVKQLRIALRACQVSIKGHFRSPFGLQQAAHRCIRNVLIIKPEGFFDEQKINIELIVEAYEFKVLLFGCGVSVIESLDADNCYIAA